MATPSWVSETLQVINGNRGIQMLGAKNIGYSDKDHTVTMQIPRNISGANYLVIRYNHSRDLYDLELQSIRKSKGTYKQTLKATLKDAYADMVKPWIERNTGMYLSLGTMGRQNPSTKIRKLSPATQKVVQVMIESMREMPESPWHPSIFTMTLRGYRGNVAPAVRYLKEMGLIDVAYHNADNQPLYLPSRALLEATKTKKNPKTKTKHRGKNPMKSSRGGPYRTAFQDEAEFFNSYDHADQFSAQGFKPERITIKGGRYWGLRDVTGDWISSLENWFKHRGTRWDGRPHKKNPGSLSALNLRKLGLDKPIKTKAQAKAWLKKLYKSPFAFHLDDPTWDIPNFGAVAANILDRQRNKVRKILGYDEMWEVYYPVKDNPTDYRKPTLNTLAKWIRQEGFRKVTKGEAIEALNTTGRDPDEWKKLQKLVARK